jgi:ABC-type lipoprotein export system ATPase subunit
MTELTDELPVDSGFEERADQIDDAVLRDGTVKNDHFDRIGDALESRGLVLLQGPRGCGKTHLMRYTALQCREDETRPLAVYVSFNRYLRLEPLLHRNADAIVAFQAWVLANIVVEADKLTEVLGGEDCLNVPELLGVERAALDTLIDHLERQIERSEEDDETVRALSIQGVRSALVAMCDHYQRGRAIVLLDDAALTLTPEYLVEFFDIVRVLKHNRVSPKASVYPGSTEYGPRFHANHEGRTVSAWLPVESDRYVETMRSIAAKRYPDVAKVPPDVDELLIYAAFGIPRAYLTMLREYNERDDHSSPQSSVNAIVQDRNKLLLAEYRSLAMKVPRLRTLVNTGESLLNQAVEAVRGANDEMAREEKQLVFGLETGGLTPIVNRMLNLLVEAGLLFEYKTEVSHGGADRVYRRFTPHLAALLAVRAFSGKSRGGSPKQIVEVLKRPSTKHPVRRKIDTLLEPSEVAALRFDLPPCQKCEQPRISETQLFCANCGTKLVSQSTFENCMRATLDNVPNLTRWQIDRLSVEGIRTVGDLVAMQDPGTELRKIHLVGEKRAERVASAINAYVDEYLS